MNTELIFATGNQNKVMEIQNQIGNLFQLKSLIDIPFPHDIEEPFFTFHENAKVKAKTISQWSCMPCFAEDSGLCIKALNGQPGVLSARYGGEKDNHTKNIQTVLHNLKNIENRNAYFITVICYYENGKATFFEGKCEGKIINEPSGHNGFGYDPIFVPDGYQQTFAEMTMAEKKSISHRGKAMTKFLNFLKEKHE